MKFKFTDPATDFSNGLSIIKSYHQSFLQRGENLLLLVDEIKQQGINETLANRCIDMHCFYFHASRLHHLDEEQGLFPLLENRSKLYEGMMDLLVQDHEKIEESWELLAQILGSPKQINDIQSLEALASEFEKKIREHLMRENEDFLPKVESLLTPEEKRQAGKKMAELRHLST